MPVIEVTNLGKAYHRGKRAETLIDEMRLLMSPGRANQEKFWALSNVSFAVERGEFISVIGRNGAGKSTLLKILSGVTEPTTGEVRIEGRVGSLLEVGVGFHPDLTGRENVYMCGGILGASYQMIQERFDKIVEFADINDFLDTSVRYYSSGMELRLGFAVASHLDQDILIIDEALSVGDAGFQQKCWTKINELLDAGTTMLLVSHSMEAAARCKRAIYLDHGQIKAIGESKVILEQYKQDLFGTESASAPDPSQGA